MAAGSLKTKNGRLVVVDIWPFLPTAFDNSTPSAWPHEKGKVVGPLLAYFLWDYEEEDDFWVETMKQVLENLRKVALQEGCTTNDTPVYSNCALREYTTVEQVYRGNLGKLVDLRRKYDPEHVMNLTGGFKIEVPC